MVGQQKKYKWITSTIIPNNLALNDKVIHYPLVNISYLPIEFSNLMAPNLIISSRHSLIAINRQLCNFIKGHNNSFLGVKGNLSIFPLRYDSLYVVGPNLKKLVEESTFFASISITSFPSIEQLYDYVIKLSPSHFVYLRGQVITKEFIDSSHHHKILSIITYYNTPIKGFSDNIIYAIKERLIEEIYFYSLMGIETFIHIVNELCNKFTIDGQSFKEIKFVFLSKKMEEYFYNYWTF